MVGRTKKLPETTPLYLRVPSVLVQELDEWVEESARSLPGGSGITRTDLIRDLLQKAVEEHRRAKGKAKR